MYVHVHSTKDFLQPASQNEYKILHSKYEHSTSGSLHVIYIFEVD